MKDQSKNLLTTSRAFKSLCKWAFNVCDKDHKGFIDKIELYAGMLLVHLTCAKFAGPAACFPPRRKEVERLFDAADSDKSGGLNLDQFNTVLTVVCANITSRIITYYTILIVVVPYLADWTLDLLNFIGIDDAILKFDSLFDSIAPNFILWIVDIVPDSLWLKLPHQIISLLMFFLVLPILMDVIDNQSRQAAARATVKKESAVVAKKQDE